MVFNSQTDVAERRRVRALFAEAQSLLQRLNESRV